MIAFYKSNDSSFGYNCTTGGDYFEMNDVAREKKSRAMMGNKNGSTPCSKEKAKKISDALKGKKFSEERKQNLSKAKKGKSHKRISDEGIKHLQNSAYHLAKRKRVYCYETNTVYDSIHDCAKAIGYPDSSTFICAICKGRHKSMKGYHFCYEKDMPKTNN